MLVGGQIQLDGCNGDVAAGERADIRAFFGQTGGRVAADPVIRAPARVGALHQRVAVDARALARQPQAAQLVIRQA